MSISNEIKNIALNGYQQAGISVDLLISEDDSIEVNFDGYEIEEEAERLVAEMLGDDDKNYDEVCQCLCDDDNDYQELCALYLKSRKL